MNQILKARIQAIVEALIPVELKKALLEEYRLLVEALMRENKIREDHGDQILGLLSRMARLLSTQVKLDTLAIAPAAPEAAPAPTPAPAAPATPEPPKSEAPEPRPAIRAPK